MDYVGMVIEATVPEPTGKKGRQRPTVFLCHGSEDKTAVRSLYDRLRGDGQNPWLDEKDIAPGEDWSRAIHDAIRNSRFVVVCLSRTSVSKTGYVQKEIGLALDRADEQPEGKVFVIPVRLERCDVPDRLRKWQYVDLFEAGGYQRLLATLTKGAGGRRRFQTQ
jgi:hypothetical protein